jgi:hypothetical protein
MKDFSLKTVNPGPRQDIPILEKRIFPFGNYGEHLQERHLAATRNHPQGGNPSSGIHKNPETLNFMFYIYNLKR